MGTIFSPLPKKTVKYIDFDELTTELDKYNYIVALTGAGISKESGLPTFRNPSDGIWQKYDPLSFATVWGFWRSPEKIWQLLCAVLKEIDPLPNPGHEALALLEHKGHLKAIITQNVDNLHQDAGSKNVIEFHGNIMKAICCSCHQIIQLNKQILRDPNFIKSLPPKCSCGKYLKPDVVLFGERIPAEMSRLANKEIKKCDMLIIIGTSASVQPASGLPILASKNGAKIVEINLEETNLTTTVTDYFIKSTSSNLILTATNIQNKNSNSVLNQLPITILNN